ncbi:MAG: hypothetical protein COZ46_04590 [Verrucomicrobia bacterium CG_4_10_14_3_um_filter_43_23]|nr:MAG: hypothetical protein AUJ82_06315 [Verrucomicrobia bacterium CG1_02_43_26]PIP59997.1 MAG: hypothetical protein COX01_00655 [Verrucomicrobia bacterium CG22_combo_CG10-13_8_21_14_all_43_17]PIX58300.1 MAG: hypothetical protein COZ46_04590 [Verrucomicrobia bacterium CG_4_10_14_3_um_filter_43_23]PIY62000.1 MAG: hypothetical protein COY94_03135 [Verrucomicrobia bacterium CG_4_10_14_0_8_um_filter_43_34]PJA44022.1 MAG: hypothetical protein CO175_05060 [Verrucomicrobia bacterium CG_4_9_14_3_um_fi
MNARKKTTKKTTTGKNKKTQATHEPEILLFDLFDPGYAIFELDGDVICYKAGSDIIIHLDGDEDFEDGTQLLLELEEDNDNNPSLN